MVKKLIDVAFIILGVSRFKLITNVNKMVFQYNLVKLDSSPLLIDNPSLIKTQFCFFDKPIDEKQLIKKNDILLKLVFPTRAIYVDLDYQGLLVPSSCCILRIKNADKLIDSLVLWQVLNNQETQKELNHLIQGTSTFVTTIKINDIKNINLKFDNKTFKKTSLYKNLNKLTNRLSYKTELLDKLKKEC